MRRSLATIALLSALALTGCGNEDATPKTPAESESSGSSTVSPAPSAEPSGEIVGQAYEGGPDPKSYDDPQALRRDYYQAGGTCVGGTINEHDEHGQYLQCDTAGGPLRIDVYDDPNFVDHAVAVRMQEGRPVLAGPNWVITGDGIQDDLLKVHPELGGTLYVPRAD